MTQHSQNGEGVEVQAFKNSVVRMLEDMHNECTHCDTEAFAYERAAKEVRALRVRQSLAREPATADVGREFRRLHEAAKGSEFDLTPADGAIARLTLFVHENGDAIAATLSRAAPSSDHSDDAAVDRFAAQMKAKLAKARAKGRGGWDDPAQCSTDHLRRLLHDHLPKGDPIDVANFCMMLAHYGASTAAPSSEPAIAEGERVEKAARYVLDNSRRGNASLNSDQYDADTQKLMTAYRDIIGKALASGFLSAAPPTINDAIPAGMAALIEPWKNHHGPLPDFDSPVACVFGSGVQYAVELLAKELGVTDWTPCDGTEEYDGDLGGTMMNIVREAMPLDQYGERMWPSEVCAALSAAPSAPATEAGEEA